MTWPPCQRTAAGSRSGKTSPRAYPWHPSRVTVHPFGLGSATATCYLVGSPVRPPTSGPSVRVRPPGRPRPPPQMSGKDNLGDGITRCAGGGAGQLSADIPEGYSLLGSFEVKARPVPAAACGSAAP